MTEQNGARSGGPFVRCRKDGVTGMNGKPFHGDPGREE